MCWLARFTHHVNGRLLAENPPNCPSATAKVDAYAQEMGKGTRFAQCFRAPIHPLFSQPTKFKTLSLRRCQNPGSKTPQHAKSAGGKK